MDVGPTQERTHLAMPGPAGPAVGPHLIWM